MPIPEFLRNLRARIGHEMIITGGVSAIIFNDQGKVLAQHRADNGNWGLPGGIMEPDEEPAPAVMREVWEETGLQVIPEQLIAVFSGQAALVVYPNEDRILFLDFIFVCRVIGGELSVNDDESLEVRFIAPQDLPPMDGNTTDGLQQALKHDPRTYFRLNGNKGELNMGMSDYVHNLREKIGHELLLMPGVAGVVINAAGEILLQRRSDNGEWGLPGGAIDPGEEPADAVIREIFEETGVEVVPERLVAVYSGPDYQIVYPNGDQAMILSITFACRPVRGEARVNDDESLEVRYFAPDALPPLNKRSRQRIEQTLRNDPKTHFRMNLAEGETN